jgi:potassium-transporting ATPase KdpC subunit
MLSQIRISIIILSAMTLITGVIYPLSMTMIAQVTVPNRANGNLIANAGKTIGSTQIGQPFSKPEYFWGRLSNTGTMPYNAAASSGSNYGPMHPDLVANAKARINLLKSNDPTIDSIPVDLVTSSGSGLDPHISIEAAEIQIHRIARIRSISNDRVADLVLQHTSSPQFGLLGPSRVNVLELNLALDKLR